MQFAELTLDVVEPSPHNPRRHRNKLDDAELTASISTHGILTPLLVRPLGDTGRFQIAAGHRRFDSAKHLSLVTVPVQVREMDDKEYLEILHIENLQREDVHPIDEAAGYKELLEQGGYDVPTLATRIGKSETYVYQRLKLNDLIKEGQKMFLAGQIGFGHAVILARLDKKQQRDLLLNHLFAGRNEPISVRELSEYVRRFLYLDLGHVPWSLDDANLLAEVGACAACPKRTGSNPSLFTDMEQNTCTDRGCFERKMQAHIQKQMDSRPGLLRFTEYAGNHKKDSGVVNGATCRRIWNKEDKCESAEGAIFIDGNERGKMLLICRNNDCSKHGLKARQAAAGPNSDVALRKKHKLEKAFRRRLFESVSKKVNALPGDKAARIVARAMWRRVGGDSKRALLKAIGHDVPRDSMDQSIDRLIDKSTPVELGRLMVSIAMAEELMVSTYGSGKPEMMHRFADLYGIDVKSVREASKTSPKQQSKNVKAAA